MSSTRPRGAKGGWVTDVGFARYDRRIRMPSRGYGKNWAPLPIDGREYHRRQLARKRRKR